MGSKKRESPAERTLRRRRWDQEIFSELKASGAWSAPGLVSWRRRGRRKPRQKVDWDNLPPGVPELGTASYGDIARALARHGVEVSRFTVRAAAKERGITPFGAWGEQLRQEAEQRRAERARCAKERRERKAHERARERARDRVVKAEARLNEARAALAALNAKPAA